MKLLKIGIGIMAIAFFPLGIFILGVYLGKFMAEKEKRVKRIIPIVSDVSEIETGVEEI